MEGFGAVKKDGLGVDLDCPLVKILIGFVDGIANLVDEFAKFFFLFLGEIM